MRFRDGSDSEYASNSVQIQGKMLRRPWQWLHKRSGKKAWALHEKLKLTETENGETSEEQSQEHAHHFLWHHKEFVPAGRLNS
jgi:hypothetical protein